MKQLKVQSKKRKKDQSRLSKRHHKIVNFKLIITTSTYIQFFAEIVNWILIKTVQVLFNEQLFEFVQFSLFDTNQRQYIINMSRFNFIENLQLLL